MSRTTLGGLGREGQGCEWTQWRGGGSGEESAVSQGSRVPK